MRRLSGWKIARIRGVDVRVHFSLVFIVFYVIFVAAAQFPLVVKEAGLAEDQVRGGPMLWGMLFAFALFASVLAHEFGHVAVARSYGVEVRGITLMMLGGISEMAEIPKEPYRELKVAIAGPIVSFALAAALLGIQALTSQPELELFSFWLGRVNLILGIFNMLPAFPMDGGRALRSLLTTRHEPLLATQIAVRAGKGFAFAFGLIGLLQLNPLLMLVGLFLWGAAQSELFLLESKAALRGIRAIEVAHLVEPLHEAAVLTHAAERMLKDRSVVLPVVTSTGGGATLRFEHMRQVLRTEWGFARVRDVMEPAPRVLRSDEQVEDALADLGSSPAAALPIEQGGKIVGIVRFSDVANELKLKALERAA